MNNHESSPVTPTGALVLALATVLALIVAAAPSAAADQDGPLYVGGLVDLGSVSAEADVDCAGENPILVTAGNSTLSATNITVTINGEDVSGLEPLGPNQAFIGNYFATENEVAHVVVAAGADELASEFLKVNCVPADPWFEFIPECDLGQAWVELGNNGPDVAIMGVRYPDLPHAGGEIPAGTSSIQPLAVQPNQFTAFSIEVDGEAIYSDGYFFNCPVPEVAEVEHEELAPQDGAVPEAAKPGEKPVADEEAGEEPDEEADEEADEEIVRTVPEPAEIIAGVQDIAGEEDADELAAGTGLEVTQPSSTGGAILVGTLLALGLALTVGSIAALRARG